MDKRSDQHKQLGKGLSQKRTPVKRDALGRRTGRVRAPERKEIERMARQGMTITEIADRLGRDPRTIAKELRQGTEVNRGHLLRTRHLDRLFTIADTLRECLYDPVLATPPALLPPGLLTVYDQDWRLDPILWFYLCVPNLDEECEDYWGPELQMLREHLAENPFWDRWHKFRAAAYGLQNDYVEAIEKADKNEVEQLPEHARPERISYPVATRLPQATEPLWDEWEPPYDTEECEQAMTILKKHMPDLEERQLELLRMLRDLNEDLQPKERIEAMIVNRRCSFCQKLP
jgi:predicted transcriptional regulator